MAIQIKQTMSVDEFDRQISELSGDYEYVAGEMLAVVSNNYCSQIAMLIGAFITLFVKQNDLGYVTGADGGYRVNGERYMPDVGFISKGKQPEPSREAYNPQPPELAVEVVSPTDREKKLLVKVSNYTAVGTVVWIVYPEEKEVHIHRPGQGAQIVAHDGTLTTDLLPGFELPVKDIFPAEEKEN